MAAELRRAVRSNLHPNGRRDALIEARVGTAEVDVRVVEENVTLPLEEDDLELHRRREGGCATRVEVAPFDDELAMRGVAEHLPEDVLTVAGSGSEEIGRERRDESGRSGRRERGGNNAVVRRAERDR